MATAKTITRTVTQPRRVKRILLELTEGEADFLITVMAHIGGSSRTSPRKYQKRIEDALKQATGLDYLQADAQRLVSRGGLHFADYPDPHGGRRE